MGQRARSFRSSSGSLGRLPAPGVDPNDRRRLDTARRGAVLRRDSCLRADARREKGAHNPPQSPGTVLPLPSPNTASALPTPGRWSDESLRLVAQLVHLVRLSALSLGPLLRVGVLPLRAGTGGGGAGSAWLCKTCTLAATLLGSSPIAAPMPGAQAPPFQDVLHNTCPLVPSSCLLSHGSPLQRRSSQVHWGRVWITRKVRVGKPRLQLAAISRPGGVPGSGGLKPACLPKSGCTLIKEKNMTMTHMKNQVFRRVYMSTRSDCGYVLGQGLTKSRVQPSPLVVIITRLVHSCNMSPPV